MAAAGEEIQSLTRTYSDQSPSTRLLTFRGWSDHPGDENARRTPSSPSSNRSEARPEQGMDPAKAAAADVADFLGHRGFGTRQLSERTVAAFASTGFAPSDWLWELQQMADDGSLAEFLVAIERSVDSDEHTASHTLDDRVDFEIEPAVGEYYDSNRAVLSGLLPARTSPGGKPSPQQARRSSSNAAASGSAAPLALLKQAMRFVGGGRATAPAAPLPLWQTNR